MFKVSGGVIYRVGRIRSGYYVLKFPKTDDPSLVAKNIKTEQDAINIIEEDIKNDVESDPFVQTQTP